MPGSPPSWASRRRPPAPPRTASACRFRELIREEIARTLDDPADVEDEIHSLFAALGE